MTLSLTKAVMLQTPITVNSLTECDFPFTLPSDLKALRKKNIHRQRRQIHSSIEEAFIWAGLDGNACVKRLICDCQQYFPEKGKSLLGDLLLTIFTFSTNESLELKDEIRSTCEKKTYEDCDTPLLEFIMGYFNQNR